MALTPKMRLFVLEYLKDRNGTQAAIRAGYPKKSAAAIASENLRKPEVADAVATALARLAVKVESQAEDVIRGLKELSEYDLADAIDPETGALLPPHEMPPQVRAAIVGIENEELFEWVGEGDARERVHIGTLRKVKFSNRKDAYDSLGKYHKLFVDRVEVKTDSTFADVLKKARDRARKR